MSLFNPKTAQELIHRWPTREEWEAELNSGWAGSNGSSASLDNIEGVVIGTSTKEYSPNYPANWHDFLYRVIRRLYVMGILSDNDRYYFQLAADQAHYAALLDSVAHLVGFNGWMARKRAEIRYYALRWFGKSSTIADEYEVFIL